MRCAGRRGTLPSSNTYGSCCSQQHTLDWSWPTRHQHACHPLRPGRAAPLPPINCSCFKILMCTDRTPHEWCGPLRCPPGVENILPHALQPAC